MDLAVALSRDPENEGLQRAADAVTLGWLPRPVPFQISRLLRRNR
jgi:hypothetical protein